MVGVDRAMSGKVMMMVFVRFCRKCLFFLEKFVFNTLE